MRALVLRLSLLAFVATFALPSNASATTLHDAADGFAMDVDIPGMRTCVLFPEDPLRQRACDGLDMAKIDELTRAQSGAIAAALVIGEGWGFEIIVRRTPSDGMAFDDGTAQDFASVARADVRAPGGKGIVGGANPIGEWGTFGTRNLARVEFLARIGADAPDVKRLFERQTVYGVAGRTGIEHVIFASDADHAGAVELAAKQILEGLRIEPPLPRPTKLYWLGFYVWRVAVPVLGLLVGAFALGRARAKRRGVRGPAATGWASIRED